MQNTLLELNTALKSLSELSPRKYQGHITVNVKILKMNV
jgi:hypothetical protein